MTPNHLANYIEELAQKEHDYNTICDECVDVMLTARRVFTDAADYLISGEQAAMISKRIVKEMT